MKKKIFISIILFIVIGFSVYFVIEKPMLEEKDNSLVDENNHDVVEQQPMNENNEEETAEETVTEKVRVAIVDTVKTAIEYIFSKETNIVAIGDSLTEGVGDQTDRGGYVGVLERTINKERQIAHFDNFGKAGNRTDQLLKRLEQDEIKASIKDADIVLITIGANDIMRVVRENFANLTYDKFANEQIFFEERLRNIFTRIQEYNPNAHIYLLGLYNPFYNYFGDIEELERIVDEWNSSSKEITSDFHATFIPMKNIFSHDEDSLLAEDHFHPNEVGYHRMAERVLEYLTSEERWAP